jgi:hypothetical protein
MINSIDATFVRTLRGSERRSGPRLVKIIPLDFDMLRANTSVPAPTHQSVDVVVEIQVSDFDMLRANTSVPAPTHQSVDVVVEIQVSEQTSSETDKTQWFAKKPASSTTPALFGPELIEEIQDLFEAGRNEFFIDGIESGFSTALAALVKENGEAAMAILFNFILGPDVHSLVASEALSVLGQIVDPSTHGIRRRLLASSLFSRSVPVRDGATLGFAYMNDPWAIPFLDEALRKERVAELRRNMEKALAQLQATKAESDR